MGFGRSALGVFALALAAAGVPGGMAGAAAPKHCDTSWKAPVDGNWNAPSNWTHGVPAVPETACITKNGTYTVHITGTAGPGSLIVGAARGKQTLSIEGSCDAQAVLSIAETDTPDAFGTIGVNATVRLTDSGCDARVDLDEYSGTLTNDGTIEVDATGVTAQRRLLAHMANEGTLRLGAGSETAMEGGIVDGPGSTTEVHLGAAGGGGIGDSEPAIQLDGTLAIVADPGFVPVDGYHFSACTNCAGHFARITGQTLADGFVVHRHYHVAPDGYPTVELKVRG